MEREPDLHIEGAWGVLCLIVWLIGVCRVLELLTDFAFWAWDRWKRRDHIR